MNRIIKVNTKQVEKIKKRLSENEKIFVAEVQGRRITNQERYCEYMRAAFNAPKEVFYNYLDTYSECACWMGYLWWLIESGYKGFALIIKSYPLMLILHPKQKSCALEFIEDCIDLNAILARYDNYLPFNIYLETPFVSTKKFSLDEATDVYNELLQ